MATVELRACALLDNVRKYKDKNLPQALSILRKVFDTLQTASENEVVGVTFSEAVSPDAFLYCAEQAGDLGQAEILEKCLSILAATQPSSPAERCRLLYCQCVLAEFQLKGKVGAALVDKVQTAVVKVLKGITLALRDKDLAHLVVRGTNYYWSAARILYRSGTVSLLLPSLVQVNAALEAIQYKNWTARVHWLMRQVVAEVAAGRDAKATLAAAAAMCEKNQLESLKSPLKRVQLALKQDPATGKGGASALQGVVKGIVACQTVYSNLIDGEREQAAELFSAYQALGKETLVGAVLGKGSKPAEAGDQTGKKDTDAEREEVFAEIGLLCALHPLPKILDDPTADAVPGRNQRTLLFEVYEKAVEHNAAAGGGAELTKEHVHELPPGDLLSPPAAELVNVAAEYILPAAARDCGLKCLRSSSLKARVLAEYALAVLQAQKCGAPDLRLAQHFERRTPGLVAQIEASLHSLCKALTSALRTGDVQLVQTGCILIWNTALPLLNPDTRGSIAKVLQQALQALESVDSNLHKLRVLLLTELAEHDVTCEYLTKAEAKVSKALSEDYVVSDAEAQLYEMERPLDRYLLPLQQCLELRSNVYYVPDSASAETQEEKEAVTREEVILLLDRISGTKQETSLHHMLAKAVDLLQATEPPADFIPDAAPPDPGPAAGKKEKPAPKGKHPPADPAPPSAAASDLPPDVVQRRRAVLRQRAALWESVLGAAWKRKNSMHAGIVRASAKHLLARPWRHPVDRKLRIDQAFASVAAAETYKCELSSKRLTLGQREFLSPTDNEPLESSEAAAQRQVVLAAMEKVGECFATALDLAEACLADEDSWVALAVAAEYLNWHREVFLRNDYLHSFRLDVAARRDAKAGDFGFALSPQLTVDAITLPGGSLAGLRVGARLLSADGQPVETAAQWQAFAADPSRTAANLAFSAELAHPPHRVLARISALLSKPECGLYPRCSAYQAPLLATAAGNHARSLLAQYVASHSPPDAAESTLAATCVSTFPTGDPASPVLKEVDELCARTIAALPTAMDAKPLIFALAAAKRLASGPAPKAPGIPLRPEVSAPQEKVLAAVEVLAGLSAAAAGPEKARDKEKILGDALADLRRDPNAELCARLASLALRDPALPKLAVQAGMVARDVVAAGRLGVRSAVLSKHAPDPAAAPDGGKAAGKKDAKAVAQKKQSTAGGGGANAFADALPPPPAGEADYTWYCNVLLNLGKALVMLVDPASQERSTQTDLRRRALECVAEAGVCALKARKEVVEASLVATLTQYDAIASSLTDSRLARGIILPSLTLIADKVLPACTGFSLSDASLRTALNLYLTLIEAARDRSDYDAGLAVMTKAFTTLPRSCHKPLWAADVLFRCKKGQPAHRIVDRLRGATGYDTATQAKAWLMFSKCAASDADQARALAHAVEVSKEDAVVHAGALVNWAIWMFSRGRPAALCTDVLYYAVDVITESVAAESESLGDEERSTVASDRRSAAASHVSPTESVMSASFAATQCGQSNAQSRAGTAAAHPPHARADFTAAQLEALCGVYLTAALIAGPGPECLIALQLASAQCAKMLATCQKELARRKATLAASRRKATQDQADLVPVIDVPTELIGYIGWELPESVCTYLVHAKPSPWLICPGSIDDAVHLASVLDGLLDNLRAAVLPLHALPVLELRRVVSWFLPVHAAAAAHDLRRLRRERARLWADLALERLAEKERGVLSGPPIAEDARREGLESLREVARQPRAGADGGDAETVSGCISVREAGAPDAYRVWLCEAEAALRDEDLAAAVGLLREATAHATAWRRPAEIMRCLVLSADVSLREGNQPQAARALAGAADILRGLPSCTAEFAQLFFGAHALLVLQAPGAAAEFPAEALAALADGFRAAVARSADEQRTTLEHAAFLVELADRILSDPAVCRPCHYPREPVYSPLAREATEFLTGILQTAQEGAPAVGFLGVRVRLLMARLQNLALEGDVARPAAAALRAAKVLLCDQREVLRAGLLACSAFASLTEPYPGTASSVVFAGPAARARVQLLLLLSGNTLQRAAVNETLRYLHLVDPAGDHSSAADSDQDPAVASFLRSDVGVRFMTMSRRQRATRERLRARTQARADAAARHRAAHAAAQRLAAEQAPDEPPALTPPAQLAPGKRGSKAPVDPAARKPSKRTSSARAAAPPDATGDPGVKDAELEWDAKARAEYPSSDSEGCASSGESDDDDAGEARRWRSVVAVPGCPEDADASPLEALSLADTALAQVTPDTADHTAGLHTAGICLLAVVEGVANAGQLRRLARKAKETDPHSTAVDDLWHPSNTAIPPAKETPSPEPPGGAAAGKKPGQKPPKPPAKGKDPDPPAPPAHAGGAADPSELSPKVLAKLGERAAGMVRAQVRRGVGCLRAALAFHVATDAWPEAAAAAHGLTRFALVQGRVGPAAFFVALAQGFRCAAHALAVFRASAHPQNRERIVLSRLASLRALSPGAPVSRRFVELQRLAHSSSPLYRNLRVWPRDCGGEPPADGVGSESPCVFVTLHLSAARRHLYAAVAQKGVDPFVGRVPFDAEGLAALHAEVTAFEEAARVALAGDADDDASDLDEAPKPPEQPPPDKAAKRPSAAPTDAAGTPPPPAGTALDGQRQLLQERLDEFFRRVFAPAAYHAPRFAGAAVVVCAAPELHGLPLEWLGVFRGAASITRDISTHHHLARTEHRGPGPAAGGAKGEKAGAKGDAAVKYVVDLFDETGGLLPAALAPAPAAATGGKPAAGAAFEGIGPSVTRGGLSCPPEQIQAVLQSAGGVVVAAVLGRLGSVLSVEYAAGLEVARAKLFVLCDKVVSAAAAQRLSFEDSRKAPALRFLESAPCVCLLLLARGAPALVASHFSSSPAYASGILKQILSATERSASVAELLHDARKAETEPATE
eukprot:gene15741-24040_t